MAVRVMRMRLCPRCPGGIAYGRATLCNPCKADRKRAQERDRYQCERDAVLAKRKATPVTARQRERAILRKRAVRRTDTPAEAQKLLAEWLAENVAR